MSALAVPYYHVTFFSDREKSIRVTEEQYAKLRTAMNEVRFVEIDGNLYNVADIKEMARTSDRTQAFGTFDGHTFYSEAEYEAYMAKR